MVKVLANAFGDFAPCVLGALYWPMSSILPEVLAFARKTGELYFGNNLLGAQGRPYQAVILAQARTSGREDGEGCIGIPACLERFSDWGV